MTERRNTGDQGERMALELLKQKGHLILETNWRHGHDELDIISESGRFIVVTEVKTLRSKEFKNPEDAVDERKQNCIMRAAEEYIHGKNIDAELRFDIIAITLNKDQSEVLHIEDAFYSTLS